MAYVYMVRCSDQTLYTGYAEDVAIRVARHNEGSGARYTRGRRPVVLVYAEWAENRSQAQRREIKIKSMTREQKLNLCDAWKNKEECCPVGKDMMTMPAG